ncbi:MAG: YicC/YloC family endoribonuclease [Hyphomicrobiaceae bacterium]
MTVQSMTGFARADGKANGFAFHWEVRSVNGRGLDVRFRIPPGYDGMEAVLREAVAKRISRGNIAASLVFDHSSEGSPIRINREALATVLAALADMDIHQRFERPRPEGVLALKGVIESGGAEPSEDDARAQREAIVASFEQALDALVAARRDEGARLTPVLQAGFDRIEALSQAIAAHPSRRPEAVVERLSQQVRRLLDTETTLSPERLHQEAILLATRADVEEELKRLDAHVAAGRGLLADAAPVGRRLDFLSQEFNREANTICSKANDIEVTRYGLELKAVIDQVREQVQNIE